MRRLRLPSPRPRLARRSGSPPMDRRRIGGGRDRHWLINISSTTVLRAIATKPGWLSSSLDTHTYVFLANVIAQNLQLVTNNGFPAVWTGTTPDYDMDPTVTGPNPAQVEASLRSLPSVFLTTTVSNLFDPNNGIYIFPTLHGLAWERAAAMEMVSSNGTSEFQLGCGLRIQGGAFRAFSFTQKKSFRVLFKSEYGAGRIALRPVS